MRIIPGKTKVGFELFRGVTLADIIIGGVAFGLAALVLIAGLPHKIYYLCGILMIAGLLLVRVDDEPMYKTIIAVGLHFLAYRHAFHRLRLVEGEKTEEQTEKEPILSRKELKAQKKAAKEERKADDKLLRSHKLTKEEENAIWLKRANQSKAKKSNKQKNVSEKNANSMDGIVGFTAIENGMIKYQQGYYGIVLEIPPVEFRFFSNYRRNNAIESGLGAVLRSINPDYTANIVKLDRPIYFDKYIQQEREKAVELRSAFENGVMREDELQSRIEVVYDRVADLERMNTNNRIINAGYFLVLYDSSTSQLLTHAADAIRSLENGSMNPHRLNDKELALFLKYSNCMDFDEREIDTIAPEDYAEWAKPRSVQIRNNSILVNDVITYNFRITKYPFAVNDAWLASVMSLPGTKVVIKAQPMDRSKSVRTIDRSLQELRGQYMTTGVDSKRIELQNHIDSLEGILATLQTENEQLLCTNVYITAYDIVNSRKDASLHPSKTAPYALFENIRKTVRRLYRENGFRINGMQFRQTEAFVGSQPNGFDPFKTEARGIPSNTLAACFPWIFATISDDKGVKYGSSDGIPVFMDFFRRDSERVNSNMVIVGKSGSGKSYATKSILTNLAADDSKIFVLDPEDEYSELAKNLHGKFINVGNAQYGRLNPFQIITSLSDDEEGGETNSGSYATHLQFLEEFFRQILPDCNKDALEYLNALLDRLYTNMGITAETDLRSLRPEDYPIFDDLYDAILKEFQTANNDYIRSMLRTLMNYISKFSSDGRNANIWNGPSTITTEENFTVFNFQSMLANRNGTVANAQMLLVLKYIDNEIIKNRAYNIKNHTNRKVIVVIDEAHVFIDTKYPVALDFMFQLAKRIRKYNGMQIVITQNIKDFVGSEEIARKSTAIINACQYSFIFSLAPNDMEDLCKLYEKAGGINEIEQEKIITAPRGQAFTIMSAQSRSTFTIEVPQNTVTMFEKEGYESHYFSSESGRDYWEGFIGDGREKYAAAYAERHPVQTAYEQEARIPKRITLVEMSEKELQQEQESFAASRKENIINSSESNVNNTLGEGEKEVLYRSVSQQSATENSGMETALPADERFSNQRLIADTGRLEQIMENMLGVMQNMQTISFDAIMSRVQDVVQQKIESASIAAPVEPHQVPVENTDVVPETDFKFKPDQSFQTDFKKALMFDTDDSTGNGESNPQNPNVVNSTELPFVGDAGTNNAAETTGGQNSNIENFDWMNSLAVSLSEFVNELDIITDMRMNEEKQRNITIAELSNLLQKGAFSKSA